MMIVMMMKRQIKVKVVIYEYSVQGAVSLSGFFLSKDGMFSSVVVKLAGNKFGSCLIAPFVSV